jgi:1D-myo-inositol-tetrakisphosphate 5-kinase/inositol-polyphosphate multikinase
VLENLTRHFAKPCVIDIKLGKQLWDEAAPPEKRAKMTKDAAGTTIASKGLRLTGCRVS